MSGNPVTYAEQELSVHHVWEDHKERIHLLAEAQERHDSARAHMRMLKELIVDRELEMLSEEASPDLSATARKQAAKAAERTDERMLKLRADLEDATIRADQAKSEVTRLEIDLRGISERMAELAGLLTFYVARTPPPKA